MDGHSAAADDAAKKCSSYVQLASLWAQSMSRSPNQSPSLPPHAALPSMHIAYAII